jgi:hypothetical protein
MERIEEGFFFAGETGNGANGAAVKKGIIDSKKPHQGFLVGLFN